MGSGVSQPKYEYDNEKVPSIGFVKELQPLDNPSTQWIMKAIPVILETNSNAKINEIIDYLKDHEPIFYEFLRGHESFQSLFDSNKGEEEIRQDVNETSIPNFKSNFNLVPLPENHEWVFDDDYFAFLRVGGWNPLMLEKVVNEIPSKFPVTNDIFKLAPGFKDDSIESAIQESRLFIQDYAPLTYLRNSSFPKPDYKFIYHPIGLFGIVKGDEKCMLKPIAIQGGQDPSKFRIYTPDKENENWQKMKFAFNAADANHQQLISHLGCTHFVMEPFVVATHLLPSDHPLKPLLLAHIEGTAFINQKALESLVSPGKIVDRLMMGDISSMIELSAKSCNEPGFNYLMLRPFLESKGTYDSPLYYPYRDDSKLIWDAIHQWTSDFVDAFYESNEDVQNDNDLQTWAHLLAQPDGGNIKNFGENDEPGKLTTKSYLAEVLTMIIFTGGVQHAAVNFTQRQLMTYAPICPAAGYKDISDEFIDTYSMLEMLPDIANAGAQIGTLATLGGIYYTVLGQYDNGNLSEKTEKSLNAFQIRLEKIEEIIKKRNRSYDRMYHYSVLLPSKIPQSINV
eukprot:gene9353-12603_t